LQLCEGADFGSNFLAKTALQIYTNISNRALSPLSCKTARYVFALLDSL